MEGIYAKTEEGVLKLIGNNQDLGIECFIDKIRNISKDIHTEISFGDEELDIVYKPSINCDLSNDSNILEDFLRALEVNREEDIRKGRTGRGCHRDDLALIVNNMDLRTFGSQGQQRTTVLSLKLSEIEMKMCIRDRHFTLIL